MLTEMQVRKAVAGEKPYKLADSRGMYLLVNQAGKYWRMDYRFDGKRKTLALGVYPEVGLAEARTKRDQARAALRDGAEPAGRRQPKPPAAGATWREVAEEWFASRSPGWADTHASKIRIRLDNDLLPWLGPRPIAEITAPDMLAALRRVEARGAVDTAHRCHQYLQQIGRYAIATGRATTNPATDLRGALQPVRHGHYATITEPAQIAALLRAIDGYSGDFVTRCALRLTPLLFVRPGELRAAQWAEFDLEAAEWRIPGERMKMGTLHIVPLSVQAVAILRDLHPLTGALPYVFSTGSRPMSDNTIRGALRRLGYGNDDMTAHGFRAMASTRLHEMGWPHPVIERQLAHIERNRTAAAYNYAEYLPERRKMMQAWADWLSELTDAAADVRPSQR